MGVGRSTSRFTIISSSCTSSSSSSLGSNSFVKRGFDVVGAELTKLELKKVTPVAIRHYREPVANNALGILHHFGVLEVRLPGPLIKTNTLIKFEKGKWTGEENPPTVGAEQLRPVGRVTVNVFDQTSFEENVEMVHEVELPAGCQEILLQEVLDHLTKNRNLSYSVWTNNCWKYVYDCQRAMLAAFAELPGTGPACQASLYEAVENLPPPSLLSDLWSLQKFCINAICGFIVSCSTEAARTFGRLGKLIFETAKPMGVKGLGKALSSNIRANIPYIRKVLRKLVASYARTFLALFNWKGVALGIVIFIIATFILRLLGITVNNTTLVTTFLGIFINT